MLVYIVSRAAQLDGWRVSLFILLTNSNDDYHPICNAVVDKVANHYQ